MIDPDDIEARAEALVGQTLGGRYRLDAVLGIGAMGAVYRAYHVGLERDVAVKLLHTDLMSSSEMRTRFSREAAAISKLDHANCVRVSDYGNDDDYQYLVMELLEGKSLGDDLYERGEEPVPLSQALDLIEEVLAGIEHAHGHGLVHRDIKPDNIFLARDGEGRIQAKVLDFGIVKLQEQDGQPQLTKVGMVFGTPHFMSPEQAMGSEVDARTDLYAIGSVLYTMLAGRQPFESDDPVKVLRQQIQDPPPPLSEEIPEVLRTLVEKLLAKKPEERYASATAVRNALAAARRSFEPQPEPVSASAPVVESSTPTEPGTEPAEGAATVPAVGVDASGPTAPGVGPGVGPGIGPGIGPGPAPAPPVMNSSFTAPVTPAPAVVASSVTEPASARPVPSPPVPPSAPAGVPMVPHAHAPSMPASASAPTAPTASASSSASPGLVVPTSAPPSKAAVWILGGVGALALLGVIAFMASGDDEPETDDAEITAKADDARKGLEALLGDGDAADDGDGEIELSDDEGGDESPKGEGGGPSTPVPSSMQAVLAKLDEQIEKKQFKEARSALESQLLRNPDDGPLHWRMAQVLTALGGTDNRNKAIESYSSAISADAALLDDDAFMASLMQLLSDPKLRETAVTMALDRLGSRVDDTLVKWLNVQSRPLGYATRQRVIAHLEGNDRGAEINRPLQRALDLWQAQSAEDDICGTFDRSIADALSTPDSYLLGTLRKVPVPSAMVDDPSAVGCPGSEEKLNEARQRYDQMFAGIDPVVPKAFRKRRKRGR